VTFKDLKKRVILEAATAEQQQSKILEGVCNKPFWMWNIEEHKQQKLPIKLKN
jgi:hypothetical protein